MSTLFTLAFWIAWLALAAWFFFRNDERQSSVFGSITLGGLVLWAAGWYLSESSFSTGLSYVVRDLFILAASGLFFLSVLSRRGRFAFMLSAAAVAVYLLRHVLFPAPDPTQVADRLEIPLDTQGEWLIELREGADIHALDAFVEHFDLTFTAAFRPASPEITELDDYYVVNVPDHYWEKSHTDDRQALEAELLGSGLIDWLEPNEVITVNPLPARKLPEVNRKFGVNDPDLEQQWAMEALNADELYSYFKKNKVTPARKAKIAILDTGVDSKHEDLEDHYVSINRKHDDDPRGHGTHCAGIAGAVTNNGKGIAGLANGTEFVSISSVKVLNAMGSGTQKGIVAGILEAADAGVDVISMSLGGMSNQSKQRAYNKAVAYAKKKGAIIVCAAGNSNRNAKQFAPVNSLGVIGVSALDSELRRAVFSNYVNDIEMGVAAPGVNIYSTMPQSRYKALSGTSMACPYVAGLVGLLRSLDPDLTTVEVYNILHETGAETADGAATGRLIQPLAAVKRVLE